MSTIVIQGCTLGGQHEVLATSEAVTYYPPARMGPDAQDAFAQFGIEWQEGMQHRDGFIVKIGKEPGVKHFDLVFEGNDPKTSRVGLRQWSGNKPNPNGRVLWAQQNVHPRDWLH